MNNKVRTSLVLILIALLAACSQEGAKRITYESMQNYKRNNCLNYPDMPGCEEYQSYDEYQFQRDSVIKPEVIRP